MRPTKSLLLLLLGGVLLLPACKIGRAHRVPEMLLPDTFDTQGMTEGNAADIGWSTLYTDTILQKLIDKALDDNKDMLIATARVKELMERKRIRLAGILPEFGINLSGEREVLNYGGNNLEIDPEFNAELTFGWELDLWGNLRWQHEEGLAEFMETVEAQCALQLSIVAEVAQMYFELKALDSELRIVRQTVEARREAMQVAQTRYIGGLTSEMPYRQSLVELARTEAMVPSIENEIKLKENELSMFLGEFPMEIPRGEDFRSMPDIVDLPVDLPSSLLLRRPDVRQAEQQLKAANARVGIALTDMFPRISLTGNIGGESDDLANFIKSPAWFVLGSVTGPIFNFGRNNANRKAAKAAYEQEVYRYEKKVLDVFCEVSNALTTFRKTKEMYRSAEALYRSALTYIELANLQYVNGVVSYMDVLDAQRQLFDAEIQVNDAKLNQLTATVSLYKALGGGLNR